MDIGYIGLGKMGMGMAVLLNEKGHNVVAYNRGADLREEAKKKGLLVKDSIEDDSVSKYNFIFHFLYKFKYDQEEEL